MKTFKPIQQLMQKQMTRREFLKHLLAIMVAMVGIKGFVQMLANPKKVENKTAEKITHGYGGARPYGM